MDQSLRSLTCLVLTILLSACSPYKSSSRESNLPSSEIQTGQDPTSTPIPTRNPAPAPAPAPAPVAVPAITCKPGYIEKSGVCVPDIYVSSIRKDLLISSNTFPWGYNQTKIVRRGSTVYMLYPVDSADCAGARSAPVGKMTLFKKDDSGPWQKGASFPFVAGGLLVTPDGVPHVYGYWDGVSSCTPNIGNGGVALFNSVAAGNISSFSQEWVSAPPSGAFSENVTGRTGAAVDIYGNMIFSEALPSKIMAWVKQPGGVLYPFEMIANPGAWFPYPFVSGLRTGYWATVAGNQTSHNTNLLVYPSASGFSSSFIGDFRGASLDFGTDTSDILEDSNGRLHVLFSYGQNGKKYFDHIVYPMGQVAPAGAQYYASDSSPVTFNFTYLRLVEINKRLFYVGHESNQLWFKEAGVMGPAPSYGWRTITIPETIMSGGQLHNVYTYISSPRGGGDNTDSYVDVLAIHGPNTDSNGLALYIRVPSGVFLSEP